LPVYSGSELSGLCMNALDAVRLSALMQRSSGSSDVTIGLIDGPVFTAHPDLASEAVREIPGRNGAQCTQAESDACLHGTFIAGILCGKRGSAAPSICPGCTLLVRPVFLEAALPSDETPAATPRDVADAIVQCIDAGARVINLSLALAQPSGRTEHGLEDAFHYAVQRRVLLVAAAGNEGTLGSSTITRYPWVIPVTACDVTGRPLSGSNLGSSIGRLGLSAPGDRITSLGTAGQPLTLGGTSVAAPFVSGAIALLWSMFPRVPAEQIKLAITQAQRPRRQALYPPLLDADAAYQTLSATYARR
jgi:subtilisin family serine protease